MKKIAITGAKGSIGRIMMRGLEGYPITPLDLPEHDVTDYQDLVRTITGHDVVIHLAWSSKTENIHSTQTDPINTVMFENVYRGARDAGVPRVLMASSAHADDYLKAKKGVMLHPYDIGTPTTPYGAHKIFMESLGRYHANQGLEVIAIRFCDLHRTGKPHPGEPHIWLSERDSVGLVKSCVEASAVPHNFVVLYGVSNNADRIHDYSNPFCWTPKDRAEDHMD